MAKRSDGIVKVDDIDEKEFLRILDGKATPQKEEDPVQETKKPVVQEQSEEQEPEEKDVAPKRTYKKKKNGEYIDAFLKPRVLKQRQCVYISQNIHEVISKIVNKIDVRNMTVGVFIDTVMAQHIKDHADDIRAIYYREEGDILKNIVNNNDDE